MTAEPFGSLRHLGVEGLGVVRIAGKHLGRDRLTPLIAEQAYHNLLLAPFAISIVAIGAEEVLVPLQIAARHVVEKQLRRLAATVKATGWAGSALHLSVSFRRTVPVIGELSELRISTCTVTGVPGVLNSAKPPAP